MLLKCCRTSKHKKKIAAYIHYSPIHRIFGIISAYILHAGIINSDTAVAVAVAATTTTAAMKSNEPPDLSLYGRIRIFLWFAVCVVNFIFSAYFLFFFSVRATDLLLFLLYSAVLQQQIVVCIFLTISSEI